MNNNYDCFFPISNYQKIFSEKDIYIDHANLNMDLNLEFGETNVKNTFENLDNIFNNKISRNSSFDENDFQKISLKPHAIFPEVNNIFNEQAKNDGLNMKENYNKKRNRPKNEEIKIEKREEINKGNKIIKFNSYKLNPITEEEKNKQKIKNKISAKKSRQKKKEYISQLESDYSKLKNKLEIIEKNSKINNNFIQLKENKDFLIGKKENLCDNCSEIENLKFEENLIINREEIDDKNNINLLNSYTEKQRKIMVKLLINQILIMMPIKIKMFQDKYLKLFTFNGNESLSDVKNKIECNLRTIQELYDINHLKNEENGLSFEQHYKNNRKSDSMAHQIYNYYFNLKNYINEFEKIYLCLI